MIILKDELEDLYKRSKITSNLIYVPFESPSQPQLPHPRVDPIYLYFFLIKVNMTDSCLILKILINFKEF